MRFKTVVLAAVVVAVLGLWGVIGGAQGTVAVNPTMVQFTASADHSATNLDGTPTVSRYDLRVYVPTAMTTIVFTQNLGKPTPDASNSITVTLAAGLASTLIKNTQYVAEVVAVGPYGEGDSAPSNPFGYAAAPRAAGAPTIK
ncbi:MAG: hypothetical protein ABFD60_01565 [Bryobacteraceae bacterium]